MRIRGKDLKPRKPRSDRGKKRGKYKTYRGKKPRRAKGRKFDKRQGMKDVLKIYWFIEQDMSFDGYYNWNRNLRSKIRKKVYRPVLRMNVPVQDINTKEKIERLAEENLYPGVWYMKGGCGTPRNRFGFKWTTMAIVRVREFPEGLKARMIRNVRMFRYGWFWKG